MIFAGCPRLRVNTVNCMPWSDCVGVQADRSVGLLQRIFHNSSTIAQTISWASSREKTVLEGGMDGGGG